MKVVKDIIKKVEKNQDITDDERQILVSAVSEQIKTIEYYSQSFAGNWDNEQVNVNWRAHKCNDHIESKIKEINEKNIIDVD